jgi:DNA-binding LacI/PurR family transcriptional regulator
VSKTTRQRVTELEKTHKYFPNISASALRNKRINTIGVIVPTIDHRIYGNIVNKIQEIGFRQGYRIILLQSFSNIDKEIECINSLKDGCVDGLTSNKTYSKR